MEDPRHRNMLLDLKSIDAYRSGYARRLREAIDAVDVDALEDVCVRLTKATTEGRRIYAIGNGGSAAIADHLCCDWTKGTFTPGQPSMRTHSLVSNVALYSAIANDYGFETVFANQINYHAEAGDVLIAISSSGNSANIINAVVAAKALDVIVIGLTGFSGGKLAQVADLSLHIPIDNYGIVEDAHQALMHIIAQFFAARRDGRYNNEG